MTIMGAKQGCQPNMAEPIRITVNGETRQAAPDETILDLLQALQIDPERVAVEFDRRIVKQPLWNTTALREGVEIEIVQFVGGG
jgi:thiamine biosynthesis protein ThiS